MTRRNALTEKYAELDGFCAFCTAQWFMRYCESIDLALEKQERLIGIEENLAGDSAAGKIKLAAETARDNPPLVSEQDRKE